MLQSNDPTPIAKKARVRTGCYTCRSRKVKCDEGSDPCQNCVKYRRQCVWPTAGGRGRPAHLNGPRAKPPCDSCRLARARCSRDRPCTRCISLSAQSECTYLLSTESHQSSAAIGSLTPLHSHRPVSNDREASEETFDDRSMSLPIQAVPTGTELSQLTSPPLNKDAPPTDLVANKRSLGASVASDRFAAGDNLRAVQTGSAAPHSPSSSRASGSRRASFGLNLSNHTGMRTNLRILSRCPTPPAFDVEDQRHYKLSFLQNLIDAWFAHVHPAQANGFLHRGTVIRRITDGTLPRRVIIAFSATAGRFRNGAAHESGLEPSLTIPENSWTNVARRLVMMEDKVDIDNVAASMMLYRHFYHCGRFDVAGNFASLGARQARLLGLYDQSSTTGNGSWVESQLSCRLTWSTLCASLETDPMGTPLSAIRLHLPSEDHNYQLGIPSTTPLFSLDDPDGRDELLRLCAAVLEVLHSEVWGNVGLMGHHVILKLLAAGITRAWHRINAHNFTRPGENPWNPNSPYQNLINALLAYRSSVPQHVQPTADNLIARASLAESTSLSMLQCQFRAILITAYRPLFLHPRARWPSTSIDLSLAPDGWINSMRQACITEAHGLCNLVEASGRLIDCEVASWLYQAIHVLVVDQLGPTTVSSNGGGMANSATGESTESIKLGERADNLVMRILPAKRMYWHVGFMTQRIARLLGAWHVSSILSEQDFGPAAKTVLPKWLKRYPLADETSNHIQEPDSSNSFVFTPSLDSVPAPEMSSNLGPDPFFRGTLFDFGFGYPPDVAGSYGLASLANNSNPSDLPTTLPGPDASSANALLDWLMSMDNAQMDHALDPNTWP